MPFTRQRILTFQETLFIIQNIRHVHHLAPTLFVLHLHTDEIILILLSEVAVLVIILKYLTLLFYRFVLHAADQAKIYLYFISHVVRFSPQNCNGLSEMALRDDVFPSTCQNPNQSPRYCMNHFVWSGLPALFKKKVLVKTDRQYRVLFSYLSIVFQMNNKFHSPWKSPFELHTIWGFHLDAFSETHL